MKKANITTIPALFTCKTSVDKYKETLLTSNTAEGEIYRLLLEGKPLSTVDIVKATNLADPNATIRNLRNNLIPVGDFWEERDGRRYKRFFIRKDYPTLPFNEVEL